MRIDSSGKVGIGTTNPTSAYAQPSLHIHATGNGAELHLTDGATGATATDGMSIFQYGLDSYIVNREAGVIRSYTNGSERMRIDSSGNVGIGTTSPTRLLTVSKPVTQVLGEFINPTETQTARIYLTCGTQTAIIQIKGNNYATDPNTFSLGTSAGDIALIPSGVEVVRVTPASLLVGTTSDPNGTSAYGSGFVAENNSRQVLRLATSSTAQLSVSRFYNPNGQVGEIKTQGTSTLYVTSSDYRLKENVVTDWDATTRLKQLRPSRFNFIVDPDTTVDGFLAHEVQDIVPEAITGVRDEMQEEEYEVTPAVLDEDGNVVTEAVMGTREVPKYQGIDQSKLVPLLVKTIQELEARITTLENA